MYNKSAKLLLFILLLASGSASAIPTRRALIIAIGNYTNGWPTPLSSLRDAECIKATLRENDFKENNIRMVTDSNASVQGINSAFEQLIKDANPGDVVVIHFSCHGEQVKALDPNKLGGLDQCVVTYDAILPDKSTDFEKDQAEYYRGQNIGKYLQLLRTKLGKKGDVVVFMDYCHSGTGTRGAGKKRGGQPPFVPKNYTTPKVQQDSSDLYNTRMNTKGSIKSRGSDDGMATFVAISATRPEEFDLETYDDNHNDIGSLTYAVCKTFVHLDSGITYRALFAKIQSVMNEKVPAQHPLIEGDELDRVLLGGNFAFQKPYVEIDNFGDNNQLTIKAGKLAGLNAGAKIGLYHAGTTDPAKGTLIDSGIVIASNTFTSTVQLNKAPGLAQPADGWVFVTEPVYKTEPINIEIETRKAVIARGGASSFSEEDIANIKSSLKDLPLVSFEGQPELLIAKGANQDSLLTVTDRCLVATIPSIVQNSKLLNAKIQDYARCKFLKDIDLKNEDVDVSVKLVPVINGVMDTNNIKNRMVGGVYEFHNHDTMRLVVRNNGKRIVYVNILDLQPDGRINAVLPKSRQRIYPVDLHISPGEEHPFDKYDIVISPPYGAEVFKVFVSTQEIDMEGLATQGEARERGGGTKPRGNLSVMEKLVKQSDGIATRGVDGINSETADGSTYNVVFRIVP